MHLHALRLELINEQGYNLPHITPTQWKYVRHEPNLYCSCNRAICPVCLRRRRYWHQCALLNRIERLGRSTFQSLTVSIPAIMPNKLAGLRAATKSLSQGLRRLLRDPLLPSTGGVSSLEIKCSPDRIHPHTHTLIHGCDLDPEMLKHLIQEHIPSADSYLAERSFDAQQWGRYCCKSSLERVCAEFDYPKQFEALTSAIRGLRRFESYGTLLCTGRHRLEGRERTEPIAK